MVQQVNNVVQRGWFPVSSTNDFPTTVYAPFEYIRSSSYNEVASFVIPARSQNPVFGSDLPNATTPDLSESIQEMFERRSQGLDSPATLMGQRYELVDPESIYTAKQMVADMIQASETQLKANVEALKVEKLKESERKENEQYEKFKNRFSSDSSHPK